jgi:cytidylate kinase
MLKNIKDVEYLPGLYSKKKPSIAELTHRYIQEWNEERQKREKTTLTPEKLSPSICFSRIIGVGAVEIADILAKKIGWRVVERQILEHITGEMKLMDMTTMSFDEPYPGKMSVYLSRLFKETAFPDNEYNRHLFATIFAVAGLGPTIFVGWGTHLVLPRDRVLAVRLICSKEYRIRRLVRIFKVNEEDIERKLEENDLTQRYFYKKVYNLEKASSHEFDLVINCDSIEDPEDVAALVELAFKEKFDIKETDDIF